MKTFALSNDRSQMRELFSFLALFYKQLSGIFIRRIRANLSKAYFENTQRINCLSEITGQMSEFAHSINSFVSLILLKLI